MAFKSVADSSEKWARRVGQAGQDYQRGVQNASGWASGAVAAKARRDAGLLAAINDGRIDAGIQRVGDNGWRTATLAKGVSAWTSNTPKAAQKYAAGLQRSMNYMQAAEQATSNIDTSTLAGRLEKARVWAETVAQQAQADKTRA